MHAVRTFAAAKAAFSIALAAGPAVAANAAGPAPQPPAGQYYLDKAHTSVTFRVSHMGFSNYTARFARVDGKLQFDPAHPTAMRVEATIDPTSLALNTPPAGFHDQLMGKGWFEAARFPQITFRSTKVELTGPHAAKVTGELSLHGVTKPVVLQAVFNGGYKPNAYDPLGARIGFSAKGTIKRSDFGISYGLPAPGSTMGVGDDIDVAIESELTSKKAP